MIKWLNQRKFSTHTLAFLLMVLPPVAMYYAARAGWEAVIWALLALVVLGNLLALAVS